MKPYVTTLYNYPANNYHLAYVNDTPYTITKGRDYEPSTYWIAELPNGEDRKQFRTKENAYYWAIKQSVKDTKAKLIEYELLLEELIRSE